MKDEEKINVTNTAVITEGQSNPANSDGIAEETTGRNKKVKGSSRMISDAIISSGRFLKLSDKAKVLYMYLIVRTDDEGAVEAYPAMVLVGATEDTLNELITKNFGIRLNDDDVVLIKNFFEQNTLRQDRTKPSRFHNLIADICPQVAADCQRNINQVNQTECKKKSNSVQSKSIQEVAAEKKPDISVFNPKEEYVIPYVMDRYGYKYGFTEADVRCLVELADMLEGISRETEHDPDGLGYEWMQDYFAIKFKTLEREDAKSKIQNIFAYLKTMIENDLRGEGKIPEVYKDTRKAG